jgi:alpha-beta hydrolase superfamily lysophospholipase
VALPRLALLVIVAGALLAAPSESRAAQRVTFKTDDGVVIAGTWYEPASRSGPAVILVPMLHRSRHDFDGLASQLASAGIGALAFDLRGHGESQGTIGADLGEMVADVQAARRFLAGRGDVTGRVGLAGASLGASLAAIAAAGDPTISSLALLSPTLDYRGVRIEAAM